MDYLKWTMNKEQQEQFSHAIIIFGQCAQKFICYKTLSIALQQQHRRSTVPTPIQLRCNSVFLRKLKSHSLKHEKLWVKL